MIEQVLLVGQVLVLLLLYVFVWRVLRGAQADLTTTRVSAEQESTIIPAAEAARARRAAGVAEPRVVVVRSNRLREGQPFVVGQGLTIGRAPDNDIVLSDTFISSHHARVGPPNVLTDLDSTNGTLVNGQKLKGSTRLKPGDGFQIGETVMRYEVPK